MPIEIIDMRHNNDEYIKKAIERIFEVVPDAVCLEAGEFAYGWIRSRVKALPIWDKIKKANKGDKSALEEIKTILTEKDFWNEYCQYICEPDSNLVNWVETYAGAVAGLSLDSRVWFVEPWKPIQLGPFRPNEDMLRFFKRVREPLVARNVLNVKSKYEKEDPSIIHIIGRRHKENLEILIKKPKEEFDEIITAAHKISKGYYQLSYDLTQNGKEPTPEMEFSYKIFDEGETITNQYCYKTMFDSIKPLMDMVGEEPKVTLGNGFIVVERKEDK